MLILLIVMVVPAIFAPLIAPHPPKEGDLKARLLPPAWVGEKTAVKTVVELITASNRDNELRLEAAQTQVQIGKARLITSGSENADRPVVVGDQLEIVTQAGGQTTYLLGTDKVGRDILSRIIYGSRISIIVAAIAIVIAGTIGTALGITAGYFSGWVDALIMRLVDISLSIPIILMALVLVAALGASFKTIVIVLVIFLWAQYARQARGETLTVRVQDYVSRAKVSGASNARIMLRHVFPNVFNSIVVLATLQVGFVIILESTLSFLGAGIPRPQPAWGLMVADGRELIITHWWVSLFPGVAIMLVVMSMNLMGDWLRDRLDPKQRQV
ncbi:MAG: peptide ABC transporter permease [SAR202 cluster bacterium Io17-Chloro-G4]|nr:MAG: peptide ABC transporter permease [SAR202 cluster bacterium Io17-Chloro-G4]